MRASKGLPAYANSTPTPAVVAAPACGPIVRLTTFPKLSYCLCSTTCPSVAPVPETMSRTESWWSVNVQNVLVVGVVPFQVTRSTARISSTPLP